MMETVNVVKRRYALALAHEEQEIGGKMRREHKESAEAKIMDPTSYVKVSQLWLKKWHELSKQKAPCFFAHWHQQLLPFHQL